MRHPSEASRHKSRHKLHLDRPIRQHRRPIRTILQRSRMRSLVPGGSGPTGGFRRRYGRFGSVRLPLARPDPEPPGGGRFPLIITTTPNCEQNLKFTPHLPDPLQRHNDELRNHPLTRAILAQKRPSQRPLSPSAITTAQLPYAAKAPQRPKPPKQSPSLPRSQRGNNAR